ncbi:DNA polymerase I [Variibacter gotjawalensis]|uniref:DNA polymerase I n=1 Tax=Variibacter gotjawalensis TaxID=1333996 RepID=A0A0S3PTI3_9BRAD|nr:DNA polymerase I [Variibacter gotjawalensis]NIK49587.1 DNA polymerase-1 [Variibacter gotjawalensis]RZS45598.1 DNA polymerase I [Variibacter gotjawalensis]BAT59271.1 DNA polymerase I [Variibacter gotjawalensis]
MAAIKKGDRIFLVDGSSFVFRAYFQSMNQDRKYNARSDGLPTGAVRLFCVKLLQFIRDGAVGIKPTHLAIIFDKTEDTFRREIYPEYKAHRPDPPDELIPQFPLMREAVRAFGLIPVEQGGFEADDIIAAYACQAADAGAEVLIVSSDKDLMQMVRPGVTFYDFESGIKGKPGYRPERRLDRDGVIEKFGVPPEKVPDVQALIGDPTDNVPGVPGIGIKTASQLINEYGDLESLLARTAEIKQPKRRETLEQNAEAARLSKKLVTLDCNMKVDTPLEDLVVPELDAKHLLGFLKAMEFTAITKRVSDLYEVDASQVEADPRLAPDGSATADLLAGVDPDSDEKPAATASAPAKPKTKKDLDLGADLTPQGLAAQRAATAKSAKIDRAAYTIIDDAAKLERFLERAFDGGVLSIELLTSSPDPMVAEIVGIALAIAPGDAAYVPVGHRAGNDLLSGGGLAPGQLPVRDVIARLAPLLRTKGVMKIGHDLKPDITVLAQHGLDVVSFDDIQLISYVLDAGRESHGLDSLAEAHLGHTRLKHGELIGKGRDRVALDNIDITRAAAYAAEAADVTLRLWRVFKPRLTAERMTTVYETLERPLVPVLSRMERSGIAIDRAMLARLSGDFAQTMARVDDEIAELAGERFNLGSPKQLGDILFGKMQLPGGSKTATGAWSTRANVLEELAEQGHVLPERILEWRQVSKLKSTYTDALPTYVNAQSNRVHTSYALAATTTGRLSSSEPNLQNIPIRREDGRKIRKAFVAPKGHKLVSADYSQIELRLLAEIANVPTLRQAFQDGVDIHAMTASEMFGVPVKDMPSDVRRRAKAINFGIIYGISAFGLANQLAIGRDEAGAYIKKYFERFPGIRDYMDETKAFCRDHGFVATIFGRKMHYPEIKASNPSLRAFNERAAINARLQGSAADIIRRAMIRIQPALDAASLSAKMLLQVHDELVFEVPDGEVEKTLPVVKRVMEEAPLPAVALRVPLQVDARAADNWDEAH